MQSAFARLSAIFAVFLLSACLFPPAAGPQVKSVRPQTPFERPGYKVLSPQGEGWEVGEVDTIGRHRLAFGLSRPSQSMSLYVNMIEIYSHVGFDTPQEFLFFVQKNNQAGQRDSRRYKSLKKEGRLDPAFGDYCVAYDELVEDHGGDRGDAPYLLRRTFGYCFIHPRTKQLLEFSYAQRSKPGEFDEKEFMDRAKAFMGGITLK